MTQPGKICPACQQIATLDAAFCLRCGHAYRTQFVPQPTMMSIPAAYPAGRPKRLWIWGLPITAIAFLTLCCFMFRPAPVLTGKWVNRSLYSSLTERYTFQPDGIVHYARENPDDLRGEQGSATYTARYYVEQGGYTKDGTFAGVVVIRSIGDSLEAVPHNVMLSADGKHLRFIRDRGLVEDFYRE